MSDSIWPAGLAKHFLSHLLKTKTRLYYWHKEGHFFLGFVIILKYEIIAQQLLWAVGGEAGVSPVKKTWWGTEFLIKAVRKPHQSVCVTSW